MKMTEITAVGQIRRLFDHVEWADARVMVALREARNAPDSIWRTYAHILGAEEVWLARIEGREQTVGVWPELTQDQCAALSERTTQRLQALIQTLDATALEQPVHYRNSAGQEFDTALGDILLHVALHGSYHRGQVAAAMRASGDAPEPTDYIMFVRDAPAAKTASAASETHSM